MVKHLSSSVIYEPNVAGKTNIIDATNQDLDGVKVFLDIPRNASYNQIISIVKSIRCMETYIVQTEVFGISPTFSHSLTKCWQAVSDGF